MSNRPARRASSKRDIVGKVDAPDPDGSDASNLAAPRKKRKTIGLKLSLTLRLLAAFLLAMTYIAGDLVFSDAAFKASEGTSYLVPYVGANSANGTLSVGELTVDEAATTYCASPFFGFDSIYWRAAAAKAGNVTVGGGTRPASTTRCTVGTAEKSLRSSHMQQSGTVSSIFFTTLSVKTDGDGKSDHLTSPERFYALNPEYQALGFVVASARVSDGEIVPPTAIYSSTTGKQITTSAHGYGWNTMRDLFYDVGLPVELLDTRRDGNETGPTFRESGLSIQVTITFRNYPLTFEEIQPWMAGTLHVADMAFSHHTTSYMSRGRNTDPTLVRDAQGGGGTWRMIEAVEYGVQVRFVVRAKGIQFAIQKGTGNIMSSAKDNAKLFFASLLAVARLMAILFSLTMSWRFLRSFGRIWCGCCPEKQKLYLSPGGKLQMNGNGDGRFGAAGSDSGGGGGAKSGGKNNGKDEKRKGTKPKRGGGAGRSGGKEKKKAKPSTKSKSKSPSSGGTSTMSSAVVAGDVEISEAGETRMAKESRQQMYQAPSARVPGAVIIAGNAALDEASGLSWDFSQAMLARQRQAFGLAKDNTHKHYMGQSSFEPGLPNLHNTNMYAFGRPEMAGSVAELGNPGSSLEMLAGGGGGSGSNGEQHHSISQALAMGGRMKFVQPEEVAMLKFELLERIKQVEALCKRVGATMREAEGGGAGVEGAEGKK